MPALNTWQVRTFGAAASTITLATKGGAVLGGVWISAKGTTPTISAYDQASTSLLAANRKVCSTVLTAIGPVDFLGGIEFGTGLQFKCASCTGSIFWRPSSAGV